MRRPRRRSLALTGALVGLVAGTLLGQLLADYVPMLGRAVSIGVDPPFFLELRAFSLTFGFSVHVNPVGAAAMLLGFLVGRRI